MRRTLFLGLLYIMTTSVATLALGATDDVVLFDGSSAIDAIRLQDVELTREDDGAIAVKNGLDDRWPGIHFTGNWNFDDYETIDIYLESTCDEKIDLYCRLDCADSDVNTMDGIVTLHLELAPRERKVWRVPLPARLNVDVRKKLFAMRGKPGGIATDSYSNDAKIFFDRSRTTAVRLFENQNGRGDSWTLEKIVAVKIPEERLKREAYLSWPPEKFFPMIDQFGQFKHADWPGKTHSLDELRAQIAIEDAELERFQPKNFDEYGGWLDGPQLEATGSFRTEKIDGVWYLVDPVGRLFWSNGVDCVGSGSCITPITDREFYFDESTPTSKESDSPLKRFLGTSSNSINNYYAGRGEYANYNFSASNLYLKYGDDWRAKTRDRALRRLRSWGLNTIGNWSDASIARDGRTPYVATVGVSGTSRFIEGSKGYWGKFVDPFSEEFAPNVRRELDRQKASAADDPFCIGYFVDNEISWGNEGELSRAALASPKDQPVKLAYLAWLRDKYDSIDAFNSAWGVELASWDDALEYSFEKCDSDRFKEDCNAFYTAICEKYFSTIAAAVKEAAPKKLYLGCRFAWTNDLARAAAQKYCDVVSYNFYKRDVSTFKPVEGPDKPVMIGEFHFGALDRGLFHPGLILCENQAERAKAYEDYLRGALSNPWIVGAHWFQYQDEATTGRFDGENYQIGFVDVCDRPYPETIEASRRVGYDMYRFRSENAKRE